MRMALHLLELVRSHFGVSATVFFRDGSSHTPPSIRTQMPQTAPVVLRCGNVVAHCNDPAAVEATLAAMSAARGVGLGTTTGTIVRNLRQAGHEQLATRLRNAAGSRGAVAHPDSTLTREIL